MTGLFFLKAPKKNDRHAGFPNRHTRRLRPRLSPFARHIAAIGGIAQPLSTTLVRRDY